jgi:PleD family two-component response regulator
MVNDRLGLSRYRESARIPARARSWGSAMPDEAKHLKLVDSSPLPATVLVIDDDPDMVESPAVMLGDHGFQVLTANDGVRGIEMFREYKPTVVLTDILMPEQDGIEVIMTMRRERRRCGADLIAGGTREIGRWHGT